MRQSKLFLSSFNATEDWEQTRKAFDAWVANGWTPLESSMRISSDRVIAIIFVKDEPQTDPIADLKL